MTSNLTAQHRPPPPIRNASSGWTMPRSFASLPPSRRTSISTSFPLDATGDVQMTFESDPRPTKKRKIGSGSHASSPLVASPMEDIYDTSMQDVQAQKGEFKGATWVATAYGQSQIRIHPSADSDGSSLLPSTQWTDGVLPETIAGRVRTPCRYRADVSVPNTPDSLINPPDAPILESKRCADYFPWSGNHPEDTSAPEAVKVGYCDKAPTPSEKESNTARGPLYNTFKNRSGLETLSAIFTLVMEKKSKHGSLSSTTTFKPPPRVTLTEVKRRSWITDLADANVPLKRLSRTIPQGIRGLALLEQCSVNAVPQNRAMWFVKCVGANEIRTLKRKGVNASITAGAEMKWLREWTVNVEQFLEAAINSNKNEKWPGGLTYCLQLCTRMYEETLMDRDHFLDWLAKNLTICTTELFATWMPVYQLFKNDLVRFRRRGRQVAGALLARLQKFVNWPTTQNYMKTKLQSAIHTLLHFRPSCFLMPDRWEQYRTTLRGCLMPSDEKDDRLYEYIEKRNERMLRIDDSMTEAISPDKRVFAILDDPSTTKDIGKASRNLLGCCNDFDKLCNLCLHWSTSRFRGGVSRIYLAARLLRRWQRDGRNIDNPILYHFSRQSDMNMLNLSDYRHLFAELSRTNAFPRSRFLQALSIEATTSISTNRDFLFLLDDLCLDEDDGHMTHLKQYLLSTSGRRPSEDDISVSIMSRLQQLLLYSDGEDDSHNLTDIERTQLRELDWSTKFKLTHWLRDQALAFSKASDQETHYRSSLASSQTFTLHQFLNIRNVLEEIGDITVLADVLRILSNTKQEHILASMVDTVHYHAQSLYAIGAFGALQGLFSQAYVTSRASRPSMLLFGTSLLDLCLQFPCQITPTNALQHDLIKGDRARALSACSPFSDGVAESLQQAGETFVDDFEAILQGEPNMNEQTLTSLFTVLINKIMKSEGVSDSQNTSMLCQLLSRLRMNRTLQADVLVKRWLSKLLTAAWSKLHNTIVLELLGWRCVSLESLLELSAAAPPASKCREAIRDIIADALLPSTRASVSDLNLYVTRIAAKRLVAYDPICGLDLLLSRYDADEQSRGIYASLLYAILREEKTLSSLSPDSSKNLPKILIKMLSLNEGDLVFSQQFLTKMNWLSLPFGKLAISLQDADVTRQSDNSSVEVANVIFESLGLHADADGMDANLCQAIVQAMPDEVQDQVRAMAERQFYNSMPKMFQTKALSQHSQPSKEEKAQSSRAMRKVICLGSARGGSTAGDSNGLMLEKLAIVNKALGAKNDAQIASSNQSVSSPDSPANVITQNNTAVDQLSDNRYRDMVFTMLDYLYMLLKILSMKASLFTVTVNAPALAKATQNEQIKLIAFLLTIATQPCLAGLIQTNIEEYLKARIRECVGFTLDVAARLVDDLSDEARIMCTKIMKDRLKDARVAWLIGSMTACANFERGPGGGLMMMHETKGFIGEFRPKRWELLESGGGKENDACLGLGLFGAKKM